MYAVETDDMCLMWFDTDVQARRYAAWYDLGAEGADYTVTLWAGGEIR